ncbi:hypothetical protein LTS18_013800 [Coniosporium uncinatum]|uniref:Uncharacterized protein n=1 Tax=Coniosporium uncinatum TaxID=93489 RepID=A0ACC3CWD3_9PEZI|nr:hypothetical protein LTS18_013800 [Coniosporium uncinatum]
MCKVNLKLLSNFLEALPQASVKPKRIMLQTGAKNYGVHLGPVSTPQQEDDPRVTLEPNFYYPQEDYLFEYCKKHSIGWNVARPSFILGAVPDAAMNVCYPLAVYCTVQKHLGKPLDFWSDLNCWETQQTQSSAMLNGYLEEWMVLNDHTANQAFNAADDSPFTWGKAWPKMASWYGMDYTKPDLDAKYHEVNFAHDPPPRGFGPAGCMRFKFSLTQWAKQPEIQDAWKDIAEKNDLAEKGFRDIDRIFSFTDAAVAWGQQINFSMDKARSMGWHGHVSSYECIMETFQDFVKLKMIPPLP